MLKSNINNNKIQNIEIKLDYFWYKNTYLGIISDLKINIESQNDFQMTQESNLENTISGFFYITII